MVRVPDELAAEYSRRLEIIIRHGDQDRCHAAVQQLFEEIARRECVASKITTESFVRDFFARGITSKLAEMEVHTLGDLQECTEQDLQVVGKIGTNNRDRIKWILEKHGMSLKKNFSADE